MLKDSFSAVLKSIFQISIRFAAIENVGIYMYMIYIFLQHAKHKMFTIDYMLSNIWQMSIELGK